MTPPEPFDAPGGPMLWMSEPVVFPKADEDHPGVSQWKVDRGQMWGQLNFPLGGEPGMFVVRNVYVEPPLGVEQLRYPANGGAVYVKIPRPDTFKITSRATPYDFVYAGGWN